MNKTCPPELEELLKTIYSLSPQETEILSLLCEEDLRVKEIAERTDKDRSTVQRYISTLRSAGLVSRRSENNKKGKGRHFVYYIQDKDRLKRKIINRLEEWKREKMEILEDL
ncbi:MAG: ArsR family transcriptional regulator [Candidatus Aenigmatarchaeota archaeon]